MTASSRSANRRPFNLALLTSLALCSVVALSAGVSGCSSSDTPATTDAGNDTDAFTSDDSGNTTDAGHTTDAGSTTDAGAQDSGLDAGPLLGVTVKIGVGTQPRLFPTKTAVFGAAGVVDVEGTLSTESIALQTDTSALGAHVCSKSSSTYVDSRDGATIYNTAGSAQAKASCTITITAVGAVGGHITGTYTASLVEVGASTATFRDVSGSFDVIRTK